MQPTIELYTRPGCHLCEEAKKIILQAASKKTFQFYEKNVEENCQWELDFGKEIPIVLINGRRAFKHRLTLRALLQYLSHLE